MSYVKKNLIDGEEVLYQASTHWFILIPSFFYGILGIFSLVFLALTAFLSLPITLFLFILSFNAALPYFVNELAMTNKRVISKKGFIRRDTSELKLSKLETIEIKQSVLGRILGFGKIICIGTGGSETFIDNIDHPLEFRKKFLEYTDKNPQ
ncbi:MAG: PH domain-containing protein [bacterium]